jgi:hypothetical protein
MNATAPSRRPLRSTGAVLAGLLAIFVLSLGTDEVLHLSGVYPPWNQPMSDGLYGLATAYRIVFGIVGCYLAARLAPSRPMLHALVLGGIGVVLSILGAIGGWHLGTHWYPLALILISLPCAWIGGKLYELQAR